jgi:hypothetical protein
MPIHNVVANKLKTLTNDDKFKLPNSLHLSSLDA